MRLYKIDAEEYNRLLVHVDKTIKHDAEKINIYKKLIRGLDHYENKVINIKIKKMVQDVLPEYSVSYYKRYGRYELYITKKNTTQSFEITLGPNEKEGERLRFKVEYLKERLKEIEIRYKNYILQSEEITEIIGQYNVALSYFQAAEKRLSNIPNWYNFSRF